MFDSGLLRFDHCWPPALPVGQLHSMPPCPSASIPSHTSCQRIRESYSFWFPNGLPGAVNIGPEQLLPKSLAEPRLIRLHAGGVIMVLRSLTASEQVAV